jgi:hypothetical protein
MGAPLVEHTKEQQRPLIRFLWPEGMKTGETDRGISECLEDSL